VSQLRSAVLIQFISEPTAQCCADEVLLLPVLPAALPSVDTYFLLDCSGAQDLGAAYSSSDSSLYSSHRASLTGLPAEVQRLLQRRQKQHPEGQPQEQQPALLFEQLLHEQGEQQQQQQVQHMHRVVATLPAQQQLQQHRRLHQQR
jgi:hypothetical protein